MAETRLSVRVSPRVDFTDMIRQLREAADALEAVQRRQDQEADDTGPQGG